MLMLSLSVVERLEERQRMPADYATVPLAVVAPPSGSQHMRARTVTGPGPLVGSAGASGVSQLGSTSAAAIDKEALGAAEELALALQAAGVGEGLLAGAYGSESRGSTVQPKATGDNIADSLRPSPVGDTNPAHGGILAQLGTSEAAPSGGSLLVPHYALELAADPNFVSARMRITHMVRSACARWTVLLS